jgi:hypothetical protein
MSPAWLDGILLAALTPFFAIQRTGESMQSLLDAAITKTAAAEATYMADATNVQTIKSAIDAATTPLAPALAQQTTDAVAYNAALDDLSKAALAAKV